MLDYRCGESSRLQEALALPDEQLIAALAGRRREELVASHASWTEPEKRARAVCRHDRRYPAALRERDSPHLLHLSCTTGQFASMIERPCVALVGATAASEYGREVTRCLARGLSDAGVTVVAALREGIGAAAHEGAQEANAPSLAVLDHGLGRPAPASLRAIRRTLIDAGSLIAELPGRTQGRRWGARAADRTVAALAAATVLVEDQEGGAATSSLLLAESRGRATGAVPGPVTSRLSTGPHAALARGARLVRRTEDVLELLALSPAQAAAARAGGGLPRRLQAVLDRLGAGWDTPEALSQDPAQRGETMAILAELELLDLARRTAAGRYIPREPAAGA
ncbi:MAG: DNA-processing protein DprA [Solirubrobacteraceae bacterium]